MNAPDAVFTDALGHGAVWLPEVGMGFYPVDPADEPYRNGGAGAYWRKYERYAETPMGEAITRARIELVDSYHRGPLVDVGIGCGAFVEARPETTGYDVSPIAQDWLHERGLWRDPYEAPVEAASCWDVLEHIQDPARLLRQVRRWLFVTVPLVQNGLRPEWKHFRTDEHRWYWTREGLLWWLDRHGFRCRAETSMEVRLGRQDVGTFVFERDEGAA